MGKGEAFVYLDVFKKLDEFYEIEWDQVDEEQSRFTEALTRISGELNALAGQVEEEMGSDLSDIFRAHATILDDASLKDEVHQKIEEELISAGSAVHAVFRRWENRFKSMEAEVAKQKADDIHDLAQRLVSSLAGIREHALENLPQGCVLVANRLLPSDTVFLARRNAAAVVLEVGGVGSHAALFAHEIGLPCVAGLNNVVHRVARGDRILVDADLPEVIVNPSQEDEAVFDEKREHLKTLALQAQTKAREPAKTLDGTPISVLANIGGPEDARAAIENGAEGIGLYRLERIYLGKQEPPNTQELLDEMRRTLEPAGERPVSVRLLDAGADKPLPFMEQLSEINPSLGLRGIRFLEKYPDLLQTQLDALLQLSIDHNLNILVPMVTLPHDMKWVREELNKMAQQKGISNLPRLGAMIEAPAAALASQGIVEYSDFISFGTNDLTQYAFASDRENAAVDAYFDDTHEAIFRLMRLVHDDAPDMPLSICGELAGRAGQVSKILDCGITTLSVAPPAIPAIKQAVRESGGA